ncbi:CAP domain-containing protein [Sorangium atrum]|uniref:CAP domain-containing protein n=1 Tax=Sorangium atrum TaxID=2995308 RepID=UPI00358DBADB
MSCPTSTFEPKFPIEASPSLGCTARRQAEDMSIRGFFSHRNPDGDGPLERAGQAGFRGIVGENLAWGQATVADVISAWLASPEHCEAMASDRYRLGGAGRAVSARGRNYWTLMLGAEGQASGP